MTFLRCTAARLTKLLGLISQNKIIFITKEKYIPESCTVVVIVFHRRYDRLSDFESLFYPAGVRGSCLFQFKINLWN
jgi:hypothetical protein